MEIISPADRARMEQQLKDLYAQRPVISTRIAEARANGDLKENADYHAAREEQGLVEAKIRELELRLRTAQVAGDTSVPKDMVFLGAVVRLRDVASGKSQTYKLVGNMTDDDMSTVVIGASALAAVLGGLGYVYGLKSQGAAQSLAALRVAKAATVAAIVVGTAGVVGVGVGTYLKVKSSLDPAASIAAGLGAAIGTLAVTYACAGFAAAAFRNKGRLPGGGERTNFVWIGMKQLTEKKQATETIQDLMAAPIVEEVGEISRSVRGSRTSVSEAQGAHTVSTKVAESEKVRARSMSFREEIASRHQSASVLGSEEDEMGEQMAQGKLGSFIFGNFEELR